jgi:LL-diaminopimelate aminotransferase
MAGWRVGMAVGNSVAVQALATIKTQIDSGIAKPIQDMAATALTGDQKWTNARNAEYQERRDLCLATLQNLGFTVEIPKAGLYIWFKTPAGYNSLDFHTLLLEKAHVSITPGHIYGSNGEGWLRLSIVTPLERLQEAMARLEKLLR